MNRNDKSLEAVTHTHTHTHSKLEEIGEKILRSSVKKAPLTRGLAPEWATGGSLGITLIALIITIIILLILAGVTLNLLLRRKWNIKKCAICSK